MELIKAGDLDLVCWAIEALLRLRPGAAAWWLELGSAHALSGRLPRAQEAWAHALRHAAEDFALLYRVGQACAAAGQDPVELATSVWSRFGNPGQAASTRAEILTESESRWTDALRGDLEPVIAHLESLVDQQGPAGAHAKQLANLLEANGNSSRAQCYLGRHLAASGRGAEALAAFSRAHPSDCLDRTFIGGYVRALHQSGKHEALEKVAVESSGTLPTGARIELAQALLDAGNETGAKTLLDAALDQPMDFRLSVEAPLMLPAVPTDSTALTRARIRFTRGLAALEHLPDPVDASQCRALVEAIQPAIYLAYQDNSAEILQCRYGRLVERWVSRAYPCEAPCPPQRDATVCQRIRIGYATSHTNFHTVMRHFSGWMEHADRTRFEIHLFPLASERDWMTDFLARQVDVVHPAAMETATAVRQIRDSGLDVLVYPEVGMDPLVFRLAALRLAPVQCVAWGHPISTGFASIDYFLSSDLMEPEDAAGRYSERLVRLPGIGACVPLAKIVGRRKLRGEFGFGPGDVLLLSPQSLFKYRPADDGVFPRIAAAVDRAVLVFVEGEYPAWTQAFVARLRAAFHDARVPYEGKVRFVPRQRFDDFLSLLQAGDVFLDCLGWSGGMTSLDALAVGLPIVTLPEATMRSRQSAAMLRQLGITETIAEDVDDYVAIAVGLGNEPNRRHTLSQRIRDGRGALFEDTRSVVSLEAFFRWAVVKPAANDDAAFKSCQAPA